MANVSIANTDAGLASKTVDLLESDQTITGLKTFSRGANAPFACLSGSAKVTYLNADQWDGMDLPADPNADCILFWDDSAGALVYLTIGTNLSITGTTIAASANVKPFIVLTAQNNVPPASSYATPDTRNAHPVLDFDAAANEEAVFQSVLPVSYNGGGLTVELYWAATSATSGNVVWAVYIERIDVGGLDTDADSFVSQTASAAATSGTSGALTKTSVPFTSGAQMDSLAAGEPFRLKVARLASDGNDTMAGDAELFRVVVRET